MDKFKNGQERRTREFTEAETKAFLARKEARENQLRT